MTNDSEIGISEEGAPAAQIEERAAELIPEGNLEADLSFSDSLVERFDRDLEQNPNEAFGRWGLAMFHSLADEKAEVFRRRLKIEPQDALDHYNLGCTLAGQEKYAEAIKEFAKAQELDPENAEAIYNHALALEKSGKSSESVALWNEYLKLCTEPEEIDEIKNHVTELTTS